MQQNILKWRGEGHSQLVCHPTLRCLCLQCMTKCQGTIQSNRKYISLCKDPLLTFQWNKVIIGRLILWCLKKGLRKTLPYIWFNFRKNSSKSSPDFAMILVCLWTVKALEQGLSMFSSGLLPPIFSAQVLRVKSLGFYTDLDICNCNTPPLCLSHWLRYMNAGKCTYKISLSQWTLWHKKES